MAKVIAQRIESGAEKLLSNLGISVEHFAPGIVAEIPVKATGLLAGADARIERDAYGNPFAVTYNDERVSLAVALVHQGKVFVYNRNGKTLQNANTNIDIIGSVGFGISALFHKIPEVLAYKKVYNTYLTDYVAVEETDGQGDKAVVKMPIAIVIVSDIVGVEEHFVEVPTIAEGQTAKLQAAIKAITSLPEGKFRNSN